MPFVAGNFTASAVHGEVLAKMDSLLVNDTTRKNLITETSIINELYTHPTVATQTPEQAAFFTDARSCTNLKISWLLDGDAAAPVAADTTDFCDPDGPEIGSDFATYAKPSGIEKTFKVITDVCKSQHSFAEKVAFGLLSKRKILVEQLEKNGAAFLVGNADTLTGVPVPKGGVTGSLWNIGAIPTGQDKEAVKDMIHITHFAQDQRYISPVIIGGNRFRYEDKLFQATSGQACGTENVGSLLSNGIPIVRDVFNMDAAASGNQDMFVVDKAGIAHVNYTWAQSPTPGEAKMVLNHPFQYYWNDPVLKVWNPVSRSIEPYRWDITKVYKCVAGKRFAVIYTITGRSGFLKMPKDITNKPQIAQVRWADN